MPAYHRTVTYGSVTCDMMIGAFWIGTRGLRRGGAGLGLGLSSLLLACGGRMSTTDRGLDANTAMGPPFATTSTCPTVLKVDSSEDSERLACGGACERTSCRSSPCQPELWVQENDDAAALVSDGEAVFWSTDARADQAGVAHIRMRSADGTIRELAKVTGNVDGLARHGDRLYWTVADGGGPGTIESMSLPNGPVSSSPVGGSPWGIAVSRDHAYWTDFQRGVLSAPLVDGIITGEPTPFGGWTNAQSLIVSNDSLFWVQVNLDNSIHYELLTTPPQGGTVACNQQWPSGLAADGSGPELRVYWSGRYIYDSNGRIMTARLGKSPQVLLEVTDGPRGLCGDERYLYWIEGRTHIMRMAK